MTKPAPVKQFRAAGGVSAAVWRNESQQGGRTVVTHSVHFQKRYFDERDQTWKTSESYFPSDLPRLRLVIEKAYEYVMMEAGRGTANETDGDTD